MDPSVRQQVGWSAGQAILNGTGARVPEHRLDPPVPIVARIVWAEDGEEHVETVALGWAGRNVYVRMPDRRVPIHRTQVVRPLPPRIADRLFDTEAWTGNPSNTPPTCRAASTPAITLPTAKTPSR